MRRYFWLFVTATLCLMVFAGFVVSDHSMAANSDGNIVVQTIPGPTLTQVFIEKFKASWPWYVARASGMVAAGALVLLMISGIGQITGYTFKLFEPLTAWATHRALGLVFAIGVIVHMASLLFDKFVPFTIINILVPWTSNFKPVTIFGFHLGSLYVALGVLAFYAIVAITITSLLWIDKKPYTWKLFHLLAYMIMVFIFVHALYLGTDVAHGWPRLIWIGIALLIAALTASRLWRARTA